MPPPGPEAENDDDDDDDDDEDEDDDDDHDDDDDGLAAIIISRNIQTNKNKKNNASKQIHLNKNAKELGWWDLNLRAHYQSHPRHPAILKSLRRCILVSISTTELGFI